MKFILRLVCLLILIFGIFADDVMAQTDQQKTDAAIERYRNYLPEQTKAMSDAERRANVPLMYIFAAQKGLAVDAELALAMDLNSLMYSGIWNYQQAIKDFQADVGEKADGKLTVWQIQELGKRAAMQKITTVYFPTSHGGSLIGDYAYVEGTVSIVDEKIAWPINHVKINCSKVEAICRYSQMILQLPRENDFSYIYSVQEFSEDEYIITSWRDDTIDAVARDNGKACRRNSLKFNFKTKEYYEIATNNGRDCAGSSLAKLPKPRISQIGNGEEIFKAEFARLRERAFTFLASSFRKRVDNLMKQVDAQKQSQAKQ
ncbi:MAG: hypothetical protein HC850_14575 [Rhodomicrobium sp.]|nr:hypothetical protein [Rhodomicrobium sp.]